MDEGSEERNVRGHIHETQSGTEEENTHSSAALCCAFLNGPPTHGCSSAPSGSGHCSIRQLAEYS